MSLGRITGNEAVKIAVGIAAPVAAYLYSKDAYNGSIDEWHRRHAEHHEHLNLAELEYSWAKYDGLPFMTKWAKRFHHVMLHGPGGIKTSWEGFKITAEGFVNDVLIKNLVPITLGIAGMYAGLGKNRIHAPFKAIHKHIIQPLWATANPHITGNWTKAAFKGIADGIVAVGKQAIKHPGFAALIAGFGLFGAFRFKRVYNGQEQEAFYKNSFRQRFWNHRSGH